MSEDRLALIDELRASAFLAVRFHAALAAHVGINVTDVTCLGVLDKHGPLSPGELARRAGLTRGGAITTAVDRLERAGFVRRSRDSTDRRKVTVILLREGPYARLSAIFDDLASAYANVIAERTATERVALQEFTTQVNSQLEEQIDRLQPPG